MVKISDFEDISVSSTLRTPFSKIQVPKPKSCKISADVDSPVDSIRENFESFSAHHAGVTGNNSNKPKDVGMELNESRFVEGRKEVETREFIVTKNLFGTSKNENVNLFSGLFQDKEVSSNNVDDDNMDDNYLENTNDDEFKSNEEEQSSDKNQNEDHSFEESNNEIFEENFNMVEDELGYVEEVQNSVALSKFVPNSADPIRLDMIRSSFQAKQKFNLPTRPKLIDSTLLQPVLKPMDFHSQSSNFVYDKAGNAISFHVAVPDNVGSNTKSIEPLLSKLPLSRSFRVGWGPNGQLVQTCRFSRKEPISDIKLLEVSSSASKHFSKGHGTMIMISNLSDSNVDRSCINMLNAHLDFYASFNRSNDLIPEISIPTKEKEIGDALEHLASVYADSMDSSDSSFSAKSTWDLVKALWSPQIIYEIRSELIESHKNINNALIEDSPFHCQALPQADPPFGIELEQEYLVAIQRARLFKLSQWLKSYFQSSSYASKIDLEKIWDKLSCFDIIGACNLCIDLGDFRLATLISQISGISTQNMIEIKKQITLWKSKSGDVWNRIDAEHKRVYRLLAGDISDAKAYDWIRGLGMLLWFNLPSHLGSISGLVQSFEQAVNEKTLTPPLPCFIGLTATSLNENLKNSDKSLWEVYASKSFKSWKNVSPLMLDIFQRQDTRFSLLKLFCNSSLVLPVLMPGTSSKSLIDYSMSFFMHDILQFTAAEKISQYATLSLLFSFATQLEISGLWHWSIYVAMSARRYTSEFACAEVVREILNRNCLKLVQIKKPKFFSPEKNRSLKEKQKESSSDKVFDIFTSPLFSPREKLNNVVMITTDSLVLDSMEELEVFLVQKVHVPSSWIFSSKALAYKSLGNHLSALDCYIKACMFSEALDIFVSKVAASLIIDDSDQSFTKLSIFTNILVLVKTELRMSKINNDVFEIIEKFVQMKSCDNVEVAESLAEKLALFEGQISLETTVAFSQIAAEASVKCTRHDYIVGSKFLPEESRLRFLKDETNKWLLSNCNIEK